MKKLYIIALCLVLGACATFKNPVTRDRLGNIESAYGIALSAAVGYRNLRLCARNETSSLNNICAQRDIVLRLQASDRVAQVALRNARTFVKNHPFLDAFDVINAAQQAVSSFQAISYNYGITK